MLTLSSQQLIKLKQKMDLYIDKDLESQGVLMHNTTLERIVDSVKNFLVKEKIINVKD